MDHLVLEDGGLGEDLHGDALPGLRVDGELYLGEGALPDGPPDLILSYSPHPHRSLAGVFSDPSLDPYPRPPPRI